VADPLDNLVRTGQLVAEPTSRDEIERFLANARRLLEDASLENLSVETRFLTAYAAAHALSLAAVRACGLRPSQSKGHRALLFQVLAHTVDAPTEIWTALNRFHTKRNKSEYEAFTAFTEAEARELFGLAKRIDALLRQRLAQRHPELLPKAKR